MQFNHGKLKSARCLKGYSVEEMARRQELTRMPIGVLRVVKLS